MLGLRSFTLNDVSQVVRLLNEQTADVPITWPTTVEEFSEEIIQCGRHYNPAFPFDPEGFLVAQAEAGLLGFVHACRWDREDKGVIGVIRCLMVERGQGAVAGQLLEAALRHLDSQGLESIAACPWETGYPWCQAGIGACWEAKAHLVEAFLAAGFRRSTHLIVMRARPRQVPPVLPPNAPAEVRLCQRREVGTTFRCHEAYLGNVRAAQVEWFPCSERSRHADARRAGYVHWVGTREEHRRRGLATYLLSHALNHMLAEGIVEVFLHSDRDNLGAQSVYQRLGFEVLGGWVSFWLGPGSPE